MQLKIKDTAGQETYRSIIRSYFHDSDCAILIFDLTSASSFASVESWYLEVKDKTNKTSKLMLVGTKEDLITN